MAKKNYAYTQYLEGLSDQELYDILYNKKYENYQKYISPDFPRPAEGTNLGTKDNEIPYTEENYLAVAKNNFDEYVTRLDELKGKRDRLIPLIANLAGSGIINLPKGQTEIFDMPDEEYIADIPFDTATVAFDQAIADVTEAPADADPTMNSLLGDRAALSSEQLSKRTAYLDEMFNKYTDINKTMGITSTAANLLNVGADFMARKKALDELENIPDFEIPGKDVVRLHRPNVLTEFDRTASRVVNTGIKKAREMGRPDLIPSILFQGSQIREKGILEQGRIDTQVDNQQALLDLQIADAFRGRQMQAEGLKFQAEDQLAKARAGIYTQFGKLLKQNFSAQADIMNKTLLNPLATRLDWLDKYGYTDEGIFNV